MLDLQGMGIFSHLTLFFSKLKGEGGVVAKQTMESTRSTVLNLTNKEKNIQEEETNN